MDVAVYVLPLWEAQERIMKQLCQERDSPLLFLWYFMKQRGFWATDPERAGFDKAQVKDYREVPTTIIGTKGVIRDEATQHSASEDSREEIIAFSIVFLFIPGYVVLVII